MKLERIYVDQLRQFREPLQIIGLNDGINIFCGPNESGKSTLVRAIRAAFFERHRSSSVDDLQPLGDSSAAPRVELDFTVAGSAWRLSKNFLKQKRCDLTIDGQLYSGDEAEEKLADLLGYRLPSRGASRAEHWGIPGLLWIEQGSGQEVQQSVANAADHLNSALRASVSEVASSSGDWVTQLVSAEREKLLTPTGKVKGEYARALAEREQLQASLEELSGKVTRYQEQVDRLGELRAQQQEDASRPWLEFRHRQELAAQQLKQVETLIAEQTRDESALQSCRAMLQLLQRQLQQQRGQADDLAQRQQAAESAGAELQQLQAHSAKVQSALDHAREQLDLARAQLTEVRQREARRQWREEEESLVPQIAGLEESLSKATELRQQLTLLQGQLQQAEIDPQQVADLQALHDQHRDLTLRQQGVATRLQFDLLPRQSIDLDGENLREQGERLLLQPARLDIPGVGQLTIRPGGNDLAELARTQERLQTDMDAQLQMLQIESLEQARQRMEQARVLENELRLTRKMLQAHAPEGLETLTEQLQEKRQARENLQRKISSLPEPMASDSLPGLSLAEQNYALAEQALVKAETAARDQDTQQKLATQTLRSAQTELEGLQRILQAPRRQQQEQQTQQQLLAQQTLESQLTQALAARAEQIDAAQPQTLRDDIQRLGEAADNLETAANLRQAEVSQLQAILETLGAQGLEEAQGETQIEHQRLQRRVDELQQRATALDLLLELLNRKRQQLTQRLQAPLQNHINRYLELLFPGASLRVDDNLMPQQLIRSGRRGEEHQAIEALSFGAREQMGLVSRLAYADLLKEAGRPTLIILDDALVHCDAQRLEQMKRILFDAARRHQVLLFTCHPGNWRDLGVPREMQMLIESGAPAAEQ